MLIIYGTAKYGKTDHVPGLFHVTTSFFHLYWFPLIPTGSAVMVSDDRGVSIGLSLKSVLFGYARAACVVAIVFGILGALMASEKDNRPGRKRSSPSRAVSVAIAIAGAAVFAATVIPAVHRPSYARATGLALQIRLAPEAIVMLDFAYGQISEDEAEQMLEECDAARAEEDAARDATRAAEAEAKATRVAARKAARFAERDDDAGDDAGDAEPPPGTGTKLSARTRTRAAAANGATAARPRTATGDADGTARYAARLESGRAARDRASRPGAPRKTARRSPPTE